jgi:hypothetical protein
MTLADITPDNIALMKHALELERNQHQEALKRLEASLKALEQVEQRMEKLTKTKATNEVLKRLEGVELPK